MQRSFFSSFLTFLDIAVLNCKLKVFVAPWQERAWSLLRDTQLLEEALWDFWDFVDCVNAVFSSLGLMVAEPFITFNFLTSRISLSVAADLLPKVKENAGSSSPVEFLLISDPASVRWQVVFYMESWPDDSRYPHSKVARAKSKFQWFQCQGWELIPISQCKFCMADGRWMFAGALWPAESPEGKRWREGLLFFFVADILCQQTPLCLSAIDLL